MAHATFPQGVDFGTSEGRRRLDEFEKVLLHNWSTYISNPAMWYVVIDSIPVGLRNLNRGNIVNMEGPINLQTYRCTQHETPLAK